MTAVSVMARHIANGIPASGRWCAIALAIRDVFPGAEAVLVTDHAAVYYAGRPCLSAVLPEQAREFVRDFDYGRPVSPFTFTLDIPEAAA